MDITPITKSCSSCGEVKSASDFYNSVKSKSGLSSRCRRCGTRATHEYNLRNKDRHAQLKSESYHRNKTLKGRRSAYSEDGTQRKCPRCDEWKLIGEFIKGVYCKPCACQMNKAWRDANPEKVHLWRKNNIEATREATRAHRARLKENNPEAVRLRDKVSDLARRGLTLDKYDAMSEKQNGCCAICGGKNADRLLAVDHDHRCCGSGRRSCIRCVRGLLCTPCNTLLHRLDFSPDWIQKALSYLQQYPRLTETNA